MCLTHDVKVFLQNMITCPGLIKSHAKYGSTLTYCKTKLVSGFPGADLSYVKTNYTLRLISRFKKNCNLAIKKCSVYHNRP